LIVYDITDRKSFDKVVSWINELKMQADKNIVIVVAGNKCDMERERQINKSDAQEFCRKMQIRHFDTSAKNGNGVEDAFRELASLIYEANKQTPQPGSARSRRGGGVQVDRRQSNFEKKKGCC
jgi:GTPase SAR1 family protein